MDPVSVGIATYKATVAVGGFLLYRDAVLTVINESKHAVSAAVCLGNRGSSYSFGWINIDAGHRFGMEFPVLRSGQDLVIHAQSQNGRYKWQGDTYFYVLQPAKFGIKNARLESAQLVSGVGRMTTVGGDLHRMSDDFTYRLT
ncbi:DUF1036 domain-containing protein [Micromonospora sp. NPDC049523]|uniref:DUF1036 domain-containing protein n=1 Tax=Micromonospora sp. NPDC049523 TaxID=3155921 RepID=UPI003447AF6F